LNITKLFNNTVETNYSEKDKGQMQ